ncbi:MAG: hypothetical protein LBK01_01300 [Burkholderiaceae bacterium]|nr:hypothetical protein [Burkholderiaceae bacterium]
MKNDRVIFRKELMQNMQVCSETIRRWRKTNRLPVPDVHISRKIQGWRLSTLQRHGINLV